MYLLTLAQLLFTGVASGSFGSPSDLLVPVVFILCGALQFMLLFKLQRNRWLFLIILAAITLLMEPLLWFVHTYTAILLIIVASYGLTGTFGAVLGAAVYWIAGRVRAH